MATTHQGHAQTTVSLILVKTMTYSRRISEKTFTNSIPGTQRTVRLPVRKETIEVPSEGSYVTSLEEQVASTLKFEDYANNMMEELKRRKDNLASQMHELGLKRVISRADGKGYRLGSRIVHSHYPEELVLLKEELKKAQKLAEDQGLTTRDTTIFAVRCSS